MGRAAHHGAAHKRARVWYIARYTPGITRCAIGGEPLTVPLEQTRLLDLAHDDADPTGRTYLGLSCRKHNRGTYRQSPRWKGRRQPDDRETTRRRELAERERVRVTRMRKRVIVPPELES